MINYLIEYYLPTFDMKIVILDILSCVFASSTNYFRSIGNVWGKTVWQRCTRECDL